MIVPRRVPCEDAPDDREGQIRHDLAVLFHDGVKQAGDVAAPDLAYWLVAEFRQDKALERSTVQSGRSKVLCSDTEVTLRDDAERVDLCCPGFPLSRVIAG